MGNATSLRWGILGTGNIARQFADGVRAGTARGALAAVASRDVAKASAFAAQFGIARAYGSYEDLLRDADVDAIYLSLPNSLHHDWTLRCLRAGKHVLCEKPIATNADQAQEMFDVARQTGRVLIEAFMYRAHPQTKAVVDAVKAGAIGRLKLVRTSFCYRTRNTAGNIRFDPTLAGGAMMDVGCYCLNFSRLLAGGAPWAVHAVGNLHASGVDEQTTVALKFHNDVTAEFTCGMGVQADNTAHVCGDEGYLTVGWPWKPPANSAYTIAGGVPPKQDNPAAKPVAPEPRTIVVPNEQPLYAIEADAFAACVLDGATPFMPPRESIENMRVIDEVRKQVGLRY